MKQPKNKQKDKPKTVRAAVFHPEFREDLRYWIEVERKVALRAFDLIEDILRDPFTGLGKPEPLKYLAPNTWSRRLTQEHFTEKVTKPENNPEYLVAPPNAGTPHCLFGERNADRFFASTVSLLNLCHAPLAFESLAACAETGRAVSETGT